MDFHGAMEAFAEAWVATNSNTQAVDMANAGPQAQNSKHEDNLTTMLTKEQTSKDQQPPGQSQLSPPVVSGVKSLPIHCIIEQTSGPLTFEHETCAGNATVEMDSYAILPSTTAFHDLVRAALLKLGYSSAESMAAKGAIQIKNWKPLSFDTITNDSKASVEDILGELIQVATLRIRISRIRDVMPSTEWTDDMVRSAVLSLLQEISQSALAKICPLSQPAISDISNWKYGSTISSEKCREFGHWYAFYTSQKDTSSINIPATHSRLTFHPTLEIQQMRDWYDTYPSPSDVQYQQFCDVLNTGHVRKERPKVTVRKLKNWWKNEKQRIKRQSTQERRNAPYPKHQTRSTNRQFSITDLI